MARKYTLIDLVRWGHIENYEARKLEELGFTDVRYEDRMSSIYNVDKNCNYKFGTDRSRRGFMSYYLCKNNPYELLFPIKNNRCRSLWQCIKKYIEISRNEEEVF